MQEIDEVRSTYMREVASLTEACRIEITARREAMGRLEPMKSRADDMTGARRVCSIACRLKLVHLCVVFSSVETCSSSCCSPSAAFRRYASRRSSHVGVVLSPYYAALLTCLLAEELARMKEKDRLPKEYVEE